MSRKVNFLQSLLGKISQSKVQTETPSWAERVEVMKGRRKIPPRIPNVEFSVELGDVNGIKLYDFPLKNKSEKKKEK
jgi:hypothetical protein